MTTPSEIPAKFIEAFKAFENIDGQPTESDVNRVFKALSHILYIIEYDESGEKHNLIGLIQDKNPYAAKYGAPFPRPK